MAGRLSPFSPGGPAGLVAERFEEGGQDFALLEWPDPGPGPFPVSKAQGEILELLLEGCSNAEIARRRRRSIRTVAHQVDALFRRLGVGSRPELFALAARRARSRGCVP